MEKERRIKTLSLVALIVAVLGLTVAFAAMSSVLKVKGTTIISPYDLDVHFAPQITTGGVTADFYTIDGLYKGNAYHYNEGNGGENATINFSEDLKTVSFTAKFMLPGDYVETTTAIENTGQLDAVISGIEYGTPVCTSDTGNKEDEKLICDNLVYSAAYANEVGSAGSYNGELKDGIVIKAGNKFDVVRLTVTLDENLDKVPSSNVSVSNLFLKINYVQK